MKPNVTRVLVVLDEASESSIPLEVAAATDIPDIDITVCSLYQPDSSTFGMDVKWLGTNSYLDSRLNPITYHRLKKLASNTDIVHIHSNMSGSIVKIIANVMSNAEIVKTEHNTHGNFGRFKRLVNGLTNPLCTSIIANSETTKKSLMRWEEHLLKATDTEVKVIYNGVDISRIEKSLEKSSPPSLPDNFLIGTAGRLVPQKNHAALLKAAAPLLRRSDASLVIVGEGPLRHNLELLANKLEIAEYTHFLGYLERRHDVYGVLDALDIFAFPSSFEGFGVAVAEAMALGTPVVASDIPVLREVVGNAGILVEAENIGEFSDALCRLYHDNDERHLLGRNGSKRVRKQFPLEKTVQEYTACYREL